MKKNLFTLSALCLATMTLVFSGCKKENNDPQEPAQVQTYQMSITASKGADNQANGPRRVLSLDGTTLNAAWQAGEQVSVYKGETSLGTLTTTEEGASVQFSGEVSGEVEKGDMLTLKFLAPSYADQKGTLAYISANCDYAIATDVEVTDIVDETIYTDGETTFENQQAIVKFTLKNEDGSATIDAKPLVIEVAGETYTVTPASATSEMFVALPGFAGQTVTLTATVDNDTYTYEKANTTLSNGQYYILTVKMTKQVPPVPEGAINGKFSVGPAGNNKQVYFSKGNLQLNGANTWQFAANQWEYFGNNQSNNHRDFFGWGTNGTSGHNPNNTSNTDSEYSWAEWGVNAITNGGNTANSGWRTLTTAEWQYLFNTRTVNGGTGNGKSYTMGQKVNGTKGVVLYPDDYTGVAYTTGSAWSTFEDAGCVFLPAAGYRSGTDLSFLGEDGNYWSSTAYDGTNAYYVLFYGSNMYPANYSTRNRGCSVRLVKNVE